MPAIARREAMISDSRGRWKSRLPAVELQANPSLAARAFEGGGTMRHVKSSLEISLSTLPARKYLWLHPPPATCRPKYTAAGAGACVFRGCFSRTARNRLPSSVRPYTECRRRHPRQHLGHRSDAYRFNIAYRRDHFLQSGQLLVSCSKTSRSGGSNPRVSFAALYSAMLSAPTGGCRSACVYTELRQMRILAERVAIHHSEQPAVRRPVPL